MTVVVFTTAFYMQSSFYSDTTLYMTILFIYHLYYFFNHTVFLILTLNFIKYMLFYINSLLAANYRLIKITVMYLTQPFFLLSRHVNNILQMYCNTKTNTLSIKVLLYQWQNFFLIKVLRYFLRYY